MWDYLPTEITTNILHRLPVKTLVRCTSLSKAFLTLITSSCFISAHIALNTTSQLLLRYFTEDKEEMYYFEPDDDTFSGFKPQGLLIPFHNYVGNWFNVVGCVNGVICLVNDCNCEGTLVILWNPSIRKFVHVPKPIMVYESFGEYESACGFGYDSVSDDYKVVRVVDLGKNHGVTQVEVYSLKSGCWRVIGVGPSYSIRKRNGYIPCFLHGSIHWTGFHNARPYIDNVILKFDMCKECFETIELPDVLKASMTLYTPLVDFYVQECRGMLALIRRNYCNFPTTCSIWVMKEYGVVTSWTKILSFDIGSIIGPMPRSFGFRENGGFIMVKIGDNRKEMKNVVVSIDPVTHAETILGPVTADPCSFYMSTYMESLALLKEGKGIEDLTEELRFVRRKRKPKMICKRKYSAVNDDDDDELEDRS